MKSKCSVGGVAFLLANLLELTNCDCFRAYIIMNYTTQSTSLWHILSFLIMFVWNSLYRCRSFLGGRLIIVCSSDKLKNKKGKKKKTPIPLDGINNSTLAFPWQLLSKKQFNLSRCNFWGSHCSWSVKSHVDTCRAGIGQGAWKRHLDEHRYFISTLWG